MFEKISDNELFELVSITAPTWNGYVDVHSIVDVKNRTCRTVFIAADDEVVEDDFYGCCYERDYDNWHLNQWLFAIEETARLSGEDYRSLTLEVDDDEYTWDDIHRMAFPEQYCA